MNCSRYIDNRNTHEKGAKCKYERISSKNTKNCSMKGDMSTYNMPVNAEIFERN